jgi:hypothetical protein
MTQPSSEVSVFKPKHVLSQIFGNPALVGSEKLEDYEKLAATIESAMKPSDAIGWLFMRDITDWSWEIRRERILKGKTVDYYVREIVMELMKSRLASEGLFDTAYHRIFGGYEFQQWMTDPDYRAGYDKELADKGYDASFILAQAYMRGADTIEAIDKRIAFHEERRNTALKNSGIWSEGLQRRLEQATPEVIEGEYTAVAEMH